MSKDFRQRAIEILKPVDSIVTFNAMRSGTDPLKGTNIIGDLVTAHTEAMIAEFEALIDANVDETLGTADFDGIAESLLARFDELKGEKPE